MCVASGAGFASAVASAASHSSGAKQQSSCSALLCARSAVNSGPPSVPTDGGLMLRWADRCRTADCRGSPAGHSRAVTDGSKRSLRLSPTAVACVSPVSRTGPAFDAGHMLILLGGTVVPTVYVVNRCVTGNAMVSPRPSSLFLAGLWARCDDCAKIMCPIGREMLETSPTKVTVATVALRIIADRLHLVVCGGALAPSSHLRPFEKADEEGRRPRSSAGLESTSSLYSVI